MSDDVADARVNLVRRDYLDGIDEIRQRIDRRKKPQQLRLRRILRTLARLITRKELK